MKWEKHAAHVEFEASFVTLDGTTKEKVVLTKVVVGGWTGRDKVALQHHMDELAKIGVKPPEHTPLFYRVGVSRLSTADAIEVIGEDSSGEVEYVLLKTDDRIWVGAGSDHTDRAIEHVGITIAKQLCDKPIATTFWLLEEIEAHWERLELKSYIEDGGKKVLYQNGAMSSLLSPAELLEEYGADGQNLENGTLMFGGTCGVIGAIRHTTLFEFELNDPVFGRTIRRSYVVVPVPIRG